MEHFRLPQKFYQKGPGGTVSGMVQGGLSGAAAGSVVPGFGTLAGALIGAGGAIMPQVLSWIIGSDKFDWNDWKKKQQEGIDRQFNKSLSNATSQAYKTGNATIGQATNAQGLAGGISGMGNAGRLNAQTYANIAENRDNAVTGITNGLEQNRASMLSSVERQAAEGEMTDAHNAPTALTYLQNFADSMSTPVMQEGVGALIGGIGKGAGWLGNLFKSGAQSGVGSGIDRTAVNGIKNAQPTNTPLSWEQGGQNMGNALNFINKMKNRNQYGGWF